MSGFRSLLFSRLLRVLHSLKMQCPSDNSPAIDQSSFWSSGNLHWDAHRIGWAVAGACTVAVRYCFLLVGYQTQ